MSLTSPSRRREAAPDLCPFAQLHDCLPVSSATSSPFTSSLLTMRTAAATSPARPSMLPPLLPLRTPSTAATTRQSASAALSVLSTRTTRTVMSTGKGTKRAPATTTAGPSPMALRTTSSSVATRHWSRPSLPRLARRQTTFPAQALPVHQSSPPPPPQRALQPLQVPRQTRQRRTALLDYATTTATIACRASVAPSRRLAERCAPTLLSLSLCPSLMSAPQHCNRALASTRTPFCLSLLTLRSRVS